MSTEQQAQQPQNTDEQPPANAPPAVPEGEKPAEVPEVKPEETKAAEPEPPKDPRQDPIGWMAQQIPQAGHKVNYLVLDWLQKLANPQENGTNAEAEAAPAAQQPAQGQSIPNRDGLTTKSQFLAFLRDGQLLAQVAQRFAPELVETVHTGEAANTKENQTSNLEAFARFAKEKLGLPADKVFSAEQLLEGKGKAAYPAVFGTLFALAQNWQPTVADGQQAGFDLDNAIEAAGKVVKKTIIDQIIAFFRRFQLKRPTQTSGKKEDGAAENGTAGDGTLEKKPLPDSEDAPAVQIDASNQEESCKKVTVGGGGDAAAPVTVA